MFSLCLFSGNVAQREIKSITFTSRICHRRWGSPGCRFFPEILSVFNLLPNIQLRFSCSAARFLCLFAPKHLTSGRMSNYFHRSDAEWSSYWKHVRKVSEVIVPESTQHNQQWHSVSRPPHFGFAACKNHPLILINMVEFKFSEGFTGHRTIVECYPVIIALVDLFSFMDQLHTNTYTHIPLPVFPFLTWLLICLIWAGMRMQSFYCVIWTRLRAGQEWSVSKSVGRSVSQGSTSRLVLLDGVWQCTSCLSVASSLFLDPNPKLLLRLCLKV